MGKLPTVKDNDSASLDRIKAVKGLLDGLMAVGNAHVPSKATDIGEVDERANPRASDLGYVEGAQCGVSEKRGCVYLHDASHMPVCGQRYMAVDGGAFIEDLRCWA